MQGWIQRALLHLQHVLRSTLNMFCDLMAISGAEEERAQNEHIERALQECGLFDSVSGLHDSRHSPLRMVDARPSVTVAELVRRVGPDEDHLNDHRSRRRAGQL